MSITNLYDQSKLIIFDLDGTLYEDTNHFAYYAEQLKLQLPPGTGDAFDAEYAKMLDGRHVVSIGKVYDALRDFVLQVDPFSMRVQKGWTWQGKTVPTAEVQQHYPDPITCDFDTLIAIGDGWWLPNVCAKHFGATDTYSAYEKTKEYMATDQFSLTRIPGLREGLLQLKEKREIVLLTNSQADDVQRLLNRLNLEGIFEQIITEARKPQHTIAWFTKLMEAYGLEAKDCLSVGDNYLNEIAPAIRLGMQTIFIDFQEQPYPYDDGMKVKSIGDTVELMVNVT